MIGKSYVVFSQWPHDGKPLQIDTFGDGDEGSLADWIKTPASR